MLSAAEAALFSFNASLLPLLFFPPFAEHHGARWRRVGAAEDVPAVACIGELPLEVDEAVKDLGLGPARGEGMHAISSSFHFFFLLFSFQ